MSESKSGTSQQSSSNDYLEKLNISAFTYRNQLMVASQYVLRKLGRAEIAIVLGSGLGGFESRLVNTSVLPYKDIPFLPIPTVKGHSGKIIYGQVQNKENNISRKILCFSGRLHAYEGYPMYQIVFCARLAYFVGCHTIILTNSSGGCIPNQTPGSVVICEDTIRGVAYRVLNHSSNDNMFGIRHPRGDKLIDKSLIPIMKKIAEKVKFPHYIGSYWWATGPVYETGSHVRWIMKNNGSCVGMSTIPSIQASYNIGLKVGVLSLCTNIAAGLTDEVLSHDVVVQNAKKSAVAFGNYVKELLLNLPKGNKSLNNNMNLLNYPIESNLFVTDSKLFPRKHLIKYDMLYKDIVYITNYLSSTLDLNLDIDKDYNFEWYKKKLEKLEKKEDNNLSSSNKSLRLIPNRSGPIPIWIIHDPMKFNISKYIDYPVSFPLNILEGFNSISTSNSCRNSILTFGLEITTNKLIIIIQNLYLDGLFYDECNYIINILYGILGHKNLHFFNLFTAFDSKNIYNDDYKSEDNKNCLQSKYGILNDFVDFHGGLPRYPIPLFPLNKESIETSVVTLKYGYHPKDLIDKLDNIISKSNSVFTKDLLNYGYWPGPTLPTPSEVNINNKSNCQLIGITNPALVDMSRQLGFDGYNIIYVATTEDLNNICSINTYDPKYDKDVSKLIINVSNEFFKTFNSKIVEYSPPSSLIRTKSMFKLQLHDLSNVEKRLKNVNFPDYAPQYQVIFKIEETWQCINEGSKYLNSQFDIKSKNIKSVLFCDFSYPIKLKKENEIFSLDLSKLPYWNKHNCGGYPYTHLHSKNNNNPFKWTLNIYEINKLIYIAIIPSIFASTEDKYKLKNLTYEEKLLSNIRNLYKYLPVFWNLNFVIRILWKLNVKNIVFLSQLFSSDINNNNTTYNNLVLVKNYIDCSKWNCLTGPNDERLGPRFTPITDPMDGNEDFKKISGSKKYNVKINDNILLAHVPNRALISKVSKLFYFNNGIATIVSGLVPSIQVAQHLGMKKCVLGLVDFSINKKYSNVKNFNQILTMCEDYFRL